MIHVVVSPAHEAYASRMPTFAILIDDGECLASEPAATYPNMLMAMADTLRTAAIIAVERTQEVGLEQQLICEVQDCATRERRAMVVRFDEEACGMRPVLRQS